MKYYVNWIIKKDLWMRWASECKMFITKTIILSGLYVGVNWIQLTDHDHDHGLTQAHEQPQEV